MDETSGYMNYFDEMWQWLTDPNHWVGPTGIWVRLGEHVGYTLIALALAAVIAVPVGWGIGHTGRGRQFVVATVGAARALPTLGLVTIFGLLIGVGLAAPMAAFVILAIPSILAGAYAGVESVEPQTVDAATAMGMTGRQVLTGLEIPLGLPLLLGGVRSAALQVVSTATLAAYVGSGGLGRFLFLGLKTQDYAQMLAGALLVIVLAIFFEVVFAGLQRVAVPRGVVALVKE